MHDDLQLFERLYCEAGPSLTAYFRRQQGLSEGAEDLMQDTFLRAFRSRERLSQASSPRAFLFGIARHVGLDARRRQHPAEPLLDEPAASAKCEDPRLEGMRQQIGALPEVLRETLLLKLQQDLSYEEIAEVLGVPIGTVRPRLHHDVLRLRQNLNFNQAPK